MNQEPEYIYTGHPKYQPPEPTIDSQGRKLFPYLPDYDLVKAVNLAIALERPLLIQGEPGCGKTLLARAIAYEFGQKYLNKEDKYPYFRWNITSRSQAQQGRYTFDALGKLRDAQMVNILGENYLKPEDRKKLLERLNKEDCEDYINYGKLGQAFLEKQHRPILLIDEIDKADIDFPNDLLAELEEPRFTIVETQKPVIAKQNPIVIITSNSERELPEAFLRRCIFYWLKFPSPEDLREIVRLHFPKQELAELFNEAINKFLTLREETKTRSTSKQASTSELLDWLRILTNKPIDRALVEVKNLFQDAAQLGILLKSKTDIERLYQPPQEKKKKYASNENVGDRQERQKSTPTYKSIIPQNRASQIRLTSAYQTAPPIDITESKQGYILKVSDFPFLERQTRHSWLRLRQPLRRGKTPEIDITATVQKIGRDGICLQPEYKPQRLNQTQLIFLEDREGSMIPFRPIIDRLFNTVEPKKFASVNRYYFRNCPRNFVYLQPKGTEVLPLERLPLERQRTVLIIISDAGAARGGYNPQRVEMTQALLEKLQPHVKALFWLNPIPSIRWTGTTAAAICKILEGRMFELPQGGIQAAITQAKKG